MKSFIYILLIAAICLYDLVESKLPDVTAGNFVASVVLINRKTGRVLTVDRTDGGQSSGNSIVLAPYNIAIDQKWTIKNVEGGLIFVSQSSNGVLTAPGTDVGTELIQTEYTGADNQKWSFSEKVSDQWENVKNVQSQKYLDISTRTTASGDLVVMLNTKKTREQQHYLAYVE